jgi:tRNA-2-methylthio-N6-dimethylallyladenosine synthase
VEDEPGVIAEGQSVVRQDKVKAWVSIMYGCNNFCSYCIVPYVRGRERSREPACILEEVRTLVAQGYREITLLGQNVNSYGKDLDTSWDFADLLSEIDKIPGDYLIRFMSSQPKDATHKLFDTMARCPHIARQLHLPVQSGCDRVLRAMNRPYTKATYLELVTYARQVMPDLVLTSDVIVGFPGETAEEAQETVALIEQVEFDALFTFIFSSRPGTPAAKMPDRVSREEKQRWFDALCDAQNTISARKHAAYVGKPLTVLVDGETDDTRWPLSARTNGGRLVHLTGDKSLIGDYHRVKITDSNTWALFGEVI